MLRKILSLVALVGLLLVGSRFVGVIGAGPVPLEIHYQLGAAPVSALEVTFRQRSEPAVARFETRLITPDVVERTRLPSGRVDLEITLVAPDGARRTFARTIEAERDAVIRLPLEHEAAAWR